jgi:hypothetical protein
LKMKKEKYTMERELIHGYAKVSIVVRGISLVSPCSPVVREIAHPYCPSKAAKRC